jgi:hypothetical protein
LDQPQFFYGINIAKKTEKDKEMKIEMRIPPKFPLKALDKIAAWE